MKSYKDYINESLNINLDGYVYPYKKILIIINNEEEYLETISYFERIIGIRFFNVANYEEPIILVISVFNLYKIISDNDGSENFWYIFDIFRKRTADSTFNDFLEYVKSATSPMYFNMDDVIYKSSDLRLINYLLIDGNKNIFKHLYLNKYKKSYESLSDTNLSEYRYPYERILIIVESKDDLLKLMEMFKNIFDININVEDNFADRIKTHLVLYVDDFYDIVEKKRNNIEFYELFSVFTTDEITVEQLIERINKRIDFGYNEKKYYNEKDIVYPYDYKKIKNLLVGKASFQSIYKKEIEKSYESLLSKLEGPSEEEVLKYLSSLDEKNRLIVYIKINHIEEIKKLLNNYSFTKKDLEYIISSLDISPEALKLLIDYILKNFTNFSFEHIFNILLFEEDQLDNIKYLILKKQRLDYNFDYISYMFKNACNIGGEKYLDFIKFLINNTNINDELINIGINIAKKKNNKEIINYLEKI